MNKTQYHNLALFDFDGTITKKDSLLELIKFIHGWRILFWGLLKLSPYIICYKIGLLQAKIAKEKLLAYFFKGMPVSDFQKKCDQFSTQLIPQMVKKEALLEITRLKREGFDIYIVTASIENWVKPWSSSCHIACIATQIEVKNGIITGKITGENCNGEEKVKRIKAQINLTDYTTIRTYGNSKGDSQMLQIGTNSFYRKFS